MLKIKSLSMISKRINISVLFPFILELSFVYAIYRATQNTEPERNKQKSLTVNPGFRLRGVRDVYQSRLVHLSGAHLRASMGSRASGDQSWVAQIWNRLLGNRY